MHAQLSVNTKNDNEQNTEQEDTFLFQRLWECTVLSLGVKGLELRFR